MVKLIILFFRIKSYRKIDFSFKIIYVARNPKDVAVSYYHLNRLIKTLDFTGDFTKFWDYFEKDLHLWCPYWSHINEGWELRNHPNVLFLFYEDMKQVNFGYFLFLNRREILITFRLIHRI